jgi:hypothetical protein
MHDGEKPLQSRGVRFAQLAEHVPKPQAEQPELSKLSLTLMTRGTESLDDLLYEVKNTALIDLSMQMKPMSPAHSDR